MIFLQTFYVQCFKARQLCIMMILTDVKRNGYDFRAIMHPVIFTRHRLPSSKGNFHGMVDVQSSRKFGSVEIKDYHLHGTFRTLVCFVGVVFSRYYCRYDDIIKWQVLPRYLPFLRGIHRSRVNSPHKGQWRRALIFSVICALTDGWVNNRDAVI